GDRPPLRPDDRGVRGGGELHIQASPADRPEAGAPIAVDDAGADEALGGLEPEQALHDVVLARHPLTPSAPLASRTRSFSILLSDSRAKARLTRLRSKTT